MLDREIMVMNKIRIVDVYVVEEKIRLIVFFNLFNCRCEKVYEREI